MTSIDMAFSFFGKKDKSKSESTSQGIWTTLDSVQGLGDVLAASNDQPQLLFKHSTRCIISRTVLRNFEVEYGEGEMGLHLLDLIAHRDVSNAIASELGVVHQSPQAIIISGGKVIKHSSHQAITAAWAKS